MRKFPLPALPGQRLLRTTTFRLALVYLALFLGSVMLVLWTVYWSTTGFITRQADESVKAEVGALLGRWQQGGVGALASAVSERARPGGGDGLYLLVLPTFTPLTGNLNAWPREATKDGWVTFGVRASGEEGGGEEGGEEGARGDDARALAVTLPGGFRLLVGRDMGDIRRFRERLELVIGWSVALTLALGALGGLAMSRAMLGRLEGVTRTAAAISGGDMVSRVPVSGSGDEYDQLALTINAMLDRIEELLAGMRHVSQGIAHDLRTPLTRLRARLELALMEEDGVRDPHAVLESTIEEVDRLLATFRALLSIAEVESGAGQEPAAPVRLDDLARRVAELYEPAAELKGVVLAVDAAAPVAVPGNEQLLAQALANLVDNAVKYTPAGGRVSLSVEGTPSGARAVVADTGPGIPEAERERVRGRFARLERDQGEPGSGLGLSLVEAVAHRHRGRLLLEDNGPGLRAVLELPG
ncbi:MAG TPA: HAMP domain-containing sensor histidine kinase [Azospirillaceae bacterium]|nr:HAMP domain-containing sensor histidine kinase [Azospirillaceae bacterium]